MSAEDTKTVIDASLYIFELAAYHRMSGGKLASQLLAAQMQQQPAQIFGQVWAEGKEPLLDRLRNHTLGAPQTLDHVSWRLQLTMGQKSISRQKNINTILNLRLLNPDADPADAASQSLPQDARDRSSFSLSPPAEENLTMELDPQQLHSLFRSLERVQQQLDSLSGQ